MGPIQPLWAVLLKESVTDSALGRALCAPLRYRPSRSEQIGSAFEFVFALLAEKSWPWTPG